MNAESAPPEIAEAELAIPEKRRNLRRGLMLAAPVVLLLGALYFYLSGGRYETTENASLQTGMVAVSPTVAGRVVSIEVRENQLVAKGQVLFRINSESYAAAVAQADAQLADARTDVAAKRADYREALSDIHAAEARAELARSEAARQRSLMREGISSRAQYDEATTAVRTAGDAITAARAKADSLLAGLSGDADSPADQQPDVRRAGAQLSKAHIDLRDTVVRAPQAGVVTRVNQLQIGNYVQPGRPVFMLTGRKFWVQANFKESQLRYMRIGQPVTIEIDAFPDSKLTGHVESFSPGTGSSFSVLPAENATGNWVKVVQRLPVQIAIDKAPADLPIGAGMSVAVEVDTGHRRHLFAADTPPSTPAADRHARP